MAKNFTRTDYSNVPSPIERKRGRPKLGREMSEYYKKEILTLKEKQFLTKFTISNNRVQSMKDVIGIQYDNNGMEKDDNYYYFKASKILSNPFAQEFVRYLQKQIHEQSCHTLEKVVNETYDFYAHLVSVGSYHAANIAYDRYVALCGFLNQTGHSVSVNTQIVAGDKQITINYIKPGEEPKQED